MRQLLFAAPLALMACEGYTPDDSIRRYETIHRPAVMTYAALPDCEVGQVDGCKNPEQAERLVGRAERIDRALLLYAALKASGEASEDEKARARDVIIQAVTSLAVLMLNRVSEPTSAL